MARSKTTLTPAQVEAYRKNPGHCPFCGGNSLDCGQVEIDGDAAWQKCSCATCHGTWIDEYRLSCIIIDNPEKHTSKDYDLQEKPRICRDRDELEYMLKSMVDAFAKFSPKSIRHPRAFTFNQARALLGRLKHEKETAT